MRRLDGITNSVDMGLGRLRELVMDREAWGNKETNMTDEMPRVAGVYLNRLKSNWLLQADQQYGSRI